VSTAPFRRVLVTGGAGFIGSHFVRLALACGIPEIVILDKLTYAGSLLNLEGVLDDPRVRFLQGDIADPDAAATAGRVRVPHLGSRSLQGDVHFVDLLERMGCQVIREPDAITVIGQRPLRGIEADMNAISDTVPTLAALAPLADGPVVIRNVQHIRYKETDRIAAVANELRRLGQEVEEYPDGLRIIPRPVRPAVVHTYNDHRMAMSFAVLGCAVPGIVLDNPGCVAKTFPDFFERLRAALDAH